MRRQIGSAVLASLALATLAVLGCSPASAPATAGAVTIQSGPDSKAPALAGDATALTAGTKKIVLSVPGMM